MISIIYSEQKQLIFRIRFIASLIKEGIDEIFLYRFSQDEFIQTTLPRTDCY
jgi:hypothetical protein